MGERPILFSGPMVRAILAGTKTQTRRPVKGKQFPPPFHARALEVGVPAALREMFEQGQWGERPFPHGRPGDLLWVRETWQIATGREAGDLGAVVRYRDMEMQSVTMPASKPMPLGLTWDHWRPSIHMPKWAARIWLRVTDVRVDRVQDITPDDAIAEGVFHGGRYSTEPGIPYPVATFADAWRSIYGESWDRNDWVWRIAFERCEAPAREGGR